MERQTKGYPEKMSHQYAGSITDIPRLIRILGFNLLTMSRHLGKGPAYSITDAHSASTLRSAAHRARHSSRG